MFIVKKSGIELKDANFEGLVLKNPSNLSKNIKCTNIYQGPIENE